MSARRICQYACLPAPNTVTECTFERFENSRLDARAVLNAVSSSALIKPRGVPEPSSRVSEPRGVVLWELVVEGFALGAELVGVKIFVLLLLDTIEGVGLGTEASDTIFTPVVVAVLAGMKRVVWPLPLGIEMR